MSPGNAKNRINNWAYAVIGVMIFIMINMLIGYILHVYGLKDIVMYLIPILIISPTVIIIGYIYSLIEKKKNIISYIIRQSIMLQIVIPTISIPCFVPIVIYQLLNGMFNNVDQLVDEIYLCIIFIICMIISIIIHAAYLALRYKSNIKQEIILSLNQFP